MCFYHPRFQVQHATDNNILNLHFLASSVTGRILQNDESFWFVLINIKCFNFGQMYCYLWVLIGCNPFVLANFIFHKKWFWKISPARWCYALHSKFAHISIVFFYFLLRINILYPFLVWIVINKDNQSCVQKSDFIEGLELKK